MKIIVFGYKRHGKDTVCEMLEDLHNRSFTSSSWFSCKKFIFDELKDKYGYKTPEECFDDRVNHRQYWYESIRDYNKDNRSRLGIDIFKDYQVYCGIRDKEEFESIRKDGLCDLAIWVDASNRLPPENSNSMNLSIEDADYVLDNNGNLDDLVEHVNELERMFNEYYTLKYV